MLVIQIALFLKLYMKNLKTILSILLLITSVYSFGQIKTYATFDEFEGDYFKNLSDDTVYVVNFWATWCAPCIAELPYFEALNIKNEGKNFKMVLVNMDSPKSTESRVIPFLSKNKIETEVVVLGDSKTYKWIDKVDTSWSGSIPITIILKGNKKHFYEKDYESVEEIEADILKINN